MSGKPLRILFSGHDFKFVKLLMSHYESNPGYEVLKDEHKSHAITDTKKSEKLLNQADIIHCEWCLGNAVWYSKNKKKDQVLLIRLHNQEMGLPYLDQIEWNNIDRIIFICQRNRNLFLERFPFLKDRAVLVYNLIDCNSLDNDKLPGAEFNLGFIGMSPMIKAPHRAFEILTSLKKIDKRYTLFIKGKHPWEYGWLWRKPAERKYCKNLYSVIHQWEYANSVVFDSHGDDMNEWFSKIGFLLSTSDREGSHQAVAEGMASGAIPVIRNWAGADLLYPEKFIFKTVNEAVELILKYKTEENYRSLCREVKKYARDNFDKSVILKKYDQLISGSLNKKML